MESSPTLHSDLKQVKRQAKELLRTHKDGNASSCTKLRLIPRLAHMSDREILNSDISLQEAQHALARGSGFATWADMKNQIAALAGGTEPSTDGEPKSGASVDQLKPTINLVPPDVADAQGGRLVGLDIGSRTIKLAKISRTERGYRLEDFGSSDITPGLVEGGKIGDTKAVADSVSRLWEQRDIREKDVLLSTGGYTVVVKLITMGKMSYEELIETIPREAEQYIPYDLDHIELDFCVLGENRNDPEKLDLVLVAAPKELVARSVDVAHLAGLNPCIIDLEDSALQRILGASHSLGDRNVALIDIGADKTHLSFLKDATPVITRDLAVGSGQIDQEIISHLDCSRDEAEAIKKRGSSDRISSGDLVGIIRTVLHDWATETRRVLDFYYTVNPEARIETVYLSGGGALVREYHNLLSQETDANVELMAPQSNMEINGERIDIEGLSRISPQTATCLGLALRGADSDWSRGWYR